MHAVDDRMKLLYMKTPQKIHKIILNDRRLKLIGITETLKISKRVEHIVYEYLNMRKLCVKWVPRRVDN